MFYLYSRDIRFLILGLLFGLLCGIAAGIATTETLPYKTWRWGKDKAEQINDCKRLLPTWVQDHLKK